MTFWRRCLHLLGIHGRKNLLAMRVERKGPALVIFVYECLMCGREVTKWDDRVEWV